MEQCINHESMNERLTRVETFVEKKSKTYEECFANINIKITRLEEQNKNTTSDIEEIKSMQKESLLLIKKMEINQATTKVRFEFNAKTLAVIFGGVAVLVQVLAPMFMK